MKFTHTKLLSFIAICCLIGLLFNSCSTTDPVSNIDEELPQIYASEECEEPVSGTTDHDIMDGPEFDDWDLVVLVHFVAEPMPSGSCECVEYEFCAYLGFPQYTEAGYQVSILSATAPPGMMPTQLISNGQNGYQGHTPMPIPGSPHTDMTRMIEGDPAPSWHQVCDMSSTSDAFLLFINYPDDMAEADWPEDPVAHTSGICIVDIVGNGNGGGSGGGGT